jgi:hypothetical protein
MIAKLVCKRSKSEHSLQRRGRFFIVSPPNAGAPLANIADGRDLRLGGFVPALASPGSLVTGCPAYLVSP